MTDSNPAGMTPLHPGVAVQYAIHGALRRDMGRMVDALGTDDIEDEAISAYAAEFLFQLHHHHTFEDDAIWPLMRDRVASMAPLLDRNLAEHAEIVTAVDAFSGAIVHLDNDRGTAHDAATHMREVVSRHLGHEEADVIPLIPDAFTLEDVARFQAESVKENPPDRFLPWALESAAEPIAAGFHGALPEPVQQLLTETWMPVWQAKVDALQPPSGASRTSSMEAASR